MLLFKKSWQKYRLNATIGHHTSITNFKIWDTSKHPVYKPMQIGLLKSPLYIMIVVFMIFVITVQKLR